MKRKVDFKETELDETPAPKKSKPQDSANYIAASQKIIKYFEGGHYKALEDELEKKYTPAGRVEILSVCNYYPFRWAASDGDIAALNLVIKTTWQYKNGKALQYMLCYNNCEAVDGLVKYYTSSNMEDPFIQRVLKVGLKMFLTISKSLTVAKLSDLPEFPEKSEILAVCRDVLAGQGDEGNNLIFLSQLDQAITSSNEVEEKSEEEAAEDVKAEDSGTPGESPSDNTDANGNSYSDVKKENNNDILAQLQQQDAIPFELKTPETEAEKMKKETEEDALVERAQKEKEKIRQELEEQEVKAPNILDKENTEEEEENTNEDSETSMPKTSDKFLYPPIPEEGVVETPTPIISDPSFVGSGVVSFAITCGLLAFHHGGKHLHGDVPPDHPDLFA
jgi:hypothetical protein